MDLGKFRDGTPLSEVNNAVDGGPLLLAATTVNAVDEAQSPSVRSVTVFPANLFICLQQIDQVEFGPYLARMCLCRLDSSIRHTGVALSECRRP